MVDVASAALQTYGPASRNLVVSGVALRERVIVSGPDIMHVLPDRRIECLDIGLDDRIIDKGQVTWRLDTQA